MLTTHCTAEAFTFFLRPEHTSIIWSAMALRVSQSTSSCDITNDIIQTRCLVNTKPFFFALVFASLVRAFVNPDVIIGDSNARIGVDRACVIATSAMKRHKLTLDDTDTLEGIILLLSSQGSVRDSVSFVGDSWQRKVN